MGATGGDGRPGPSRRRFLIGGAGTVVGLLGAGMLGVETSVLPGKTRVQDWLHGVSAGLPEVTAGPTVSGSFVSAERHGARTGWTVAYPPNPPARLGVLVVLHGRGGDHTQAFGSHLGLDRFLAQAVSRGVPPFAIASVDGGADSYWHPRRDGNSAGMVTEEFVPLLAARGLDTTRLGLLGWSMGGYGALWIATQLRTRLRVAVAESPAIWHEPWQSAPGAFDDAADFTAHAIFGHTALLAGLALRIDCGADDGFAPATRDLRALISPTPAGGIEPGTHDMGYWRSQAAAQLGFAGPLLSRQPP